MTHSQNLPTHSSLGQARPKLHLAQSYSKDLSDLLVPFARQAGFELLLWQKQELADWTAMNDESRWVHPRCGSSVERQQGKSVDGLIWAWAASSLLGYRVLWSDHNYDTACEMRDRTRDVFGMHPNDLARGIQTFNKRVKRVNNNTGQEAFWFKSGGKLGFSTRTNTAGLGKGYDIIIVDEAQEFDDAEAQAMAPMMASAPKGNPQMIYLGTPRRAGSKADKFDKVRKEAWSDNPPTDLCWLEYGVTEQVDINDESIWWDVMPSLGAHTTIQAMRVIKSSMSDLAFLQDCLGYWLPEQQIVDQPLITEESWDDCEVGKAPVKLTDKDVRYAFGVKYSLDGLKYAMVGAARHDDGVHIELLDYADAGGATATLAKFLSERADKACCVVVDGKSRADALEDETVEAGAPRRYVIRPRAGDVIAANSMLLDAVEESTMTHLADKVLRDSATQSTKRNIGNYGGWGFGGDLAEIIEAAALALWGARTCKRNPKRKSKVHV